MVRWKHVCCTSWIEHLSLVFTAEYPSAARNSKTKCFGAEDKLGLGTDVTALSKQQLSPAWLSRGVCLFFNLFLCIIGVQVAQN